MIAVGYVRVSTDGQATDGVSLDAQRERIQLWAQAHGYELVNVFVDAGVSGGRADNRPELQAALNAAESIGAALVVYSLSRLARSVRDTLEIADRLDAAEADLVSLTERIDTTTAAGRMVFRMLAVLSEFERDLVSERTRAAMAHKRANGKVVGEVPFGYTRDGDELVEDASQQAALAMMRTLRQAGHSYRSIAARLEARGYLTARGGATWNPGTVQRILARPNFEEVPR
jgi:DNA invertase Pin-like site-specific DNA recombinase